MRVVWIMSVFNSDRTIASAVHSIQGQDDGDWQLVVVDDGSTDQTWQVLSELSAGDQRMHVLRNSRNEGLAASLNRAWRHLPADVYVRMDADDACHPQRLGQQLDFFRQNPDVDVLGTAAVLVGHQDEELGRLTRPQRHEQLVSRILRENPFVHPTVALRHRFLEHTGGYDALLRRSQDYDLWLRGYRNFRFHNLTEPLLRYRMRSVPSWSAIFWGTRTLLRAVGREQRKLGAYWYPLRFFTAATLMHLRLRRHPAFRECG